MLLAVKERVDNTFDYHGGLGYVTEEAFHSILKGQLKVKRYQLKKRMLEGKDKPKLIRQDHWVKLSKLIMEEKKQQEEEKLRYSRSQVRRPSSAGRNEEYVRANLAIELDRSPTRVEIERELARVKNAPRKLIENSSQGRKPPRVAECLMHSQNTTVIGGDPWRRTLNASCSTCRFPLSPPRRQQVQKAAPAQSPSASTHQQSQITSMKVSSYSREYSKQGSANCSLQLQTRKRTFLQQVM